MDIHPYNQSSKEGALPLSNLFNMMTSDETNLNSLKLDIEGARQTLSAVVDGDKEIKETYKPIPDSDHRSSAGG